MAAPTYVNASTGSTDAGGAWTHTGQAPAASGRLMILHVLQDGYLDIGDPVQAVTVSSVTNMNSLEGTANVMTFLGAFPVGVVGSEPAALHHFWAGRSTSTTAPVVTGANSTTDDIYIRLYQFLDASTSSIVGEVLENAPASAPTYISKIGTLGTGNDQFNGPWQIGFDGTNIYVADRDNARIHKRLASDLSYISKIGTLGSGNDQFSNPSGICSDGTHVYVCDGGNNRIVKRLCSDLSYVSQIGTLGTGNDQFNGPFNIAVDPDGTNLYITDPGNSRIVKRLCSDLSYVSQIGTAGTGNDQFNNPLGIGIDPAGTYLYVADANNSRIHKRLASDLSYVSKSGTGVSSYCAGLGVDADYVYYSSDGPMVFGTQLGYVAKLRTSDMTFYSAAGGFVGNANSQVSYPLIGVSVGPDGNIYVGDTEGQRIMKFSPSGYLNVWAAHVDYNTSTSVGDAKVVTTDTDRLAVNLVAVNDDQTLAAFTGMTGGTWVSQATYVTATGTDGAIQLQTAAMAAAGTVDGGTQTIALSSSWGVVGFAIIGTTPPTVTYVPRHPAINHQNPALV